jgi:hypothetical protein
MAARDGAVLLQQQVGAPAAPARQQYHAEPGAAANRHPAEQSDGSEKFAHDCCSRPGVSGGGR